MAPALPKIRALGPALDRARAVAIVHDADPAPAQKRRAQAVTSRAALDGRKAAASTNFGQNQRGGRAVAREGRRRRCRRRHVRHGSRSGGGRQAAARRPRPKNSARERMRNGAAARWNPPFSA